MPEVKEPVEGSLDGDKLLPALKSISTYCSSDEARPVLSGVSLSLNQSIEIAAGDGFRMAYQILPISFPSEARTIIPHRSVQVVSGLWDRIPPPVPLAESLVS